MAAGVRDQHVDAAEVVEDRLHRGAGGCRIRRIRDDRHRADGGLDRLQRLDPAADDDDVRALGGESLGDRGSDAGAAAGDHHDPAGDAGSGECHVWSSRETMREKWNGRCTRSR